MVCMAWYLCEHDLGPAEHERVRVGSGQAMKVQSRAAIATKAANKKTFAL